MGNGLKGKVYNLPYSAIGYVLPKDVKTDQYGRVTDPRVSASDTAELGLATKFADLPKVGQYKYSGVSFGANSQGNFSLLADFGNKTVSGDITNRKLLNSGAGLSDIKLNTTSISSISVNGQEVHFMGTASTHVEGMTVNSSYAGRFMGPNGEEVVGYVLDDYLNPYEGFIGQR